MKKGDTAMKVREIMTSGSLATATLDTTLEEIANMMKAEDVGAIPVLDDDDKLAGIITDRDIVVRAIAEGEDPTECTAEDILSEQLHTIEPDADLQEAINLMSQHQIRRLPVVEEEQVIGIISLGDVSVKSQTEEAGEALEDISSPIHAQKPTHEREPEGVRQESGRGNRQEQPGRNRQQASNRENGGREGGNGRSKQSNSRNQRTQQASSGEQGAEEAEYQRGSQDTSIRRGTAQMGGTRSESGQSGRVRNESQSRQTMQNELVDVEGEQEPEFQNAGGGQARRRANKQNITARGRQDSSARGRDSGAVRGENAARSSRGATQGISNRSSRQENQRQQKVAPMRAEGKNARNQGKRRAG
jgi:CBS domain-containing protein